MTTIEVILEAIDPTGVKAVIGDPTEEITLGAYDYIT